MIWFGLVGSSSAGVGDFKVIVHPKSPVAAVDREFLRSAFLKKATHWRDGTPIRPISLSRRSPVRELFVREVLRRTPSQLKSYWSQRIFSGTGVPPPEASSVAAAVAYVVANPGAVAYLPAAADPGQAKVVELHGR